MGLQVIYWFNEQPLCFAETFFTELFIVRDGWMDGRYGSQGGSERLGRLKRAINPTLVGDLLRTYA